MHVLLRIPNLPLQPAEFKKIKSESKTKTGDKITAVDQLNAVIRAIEHKHGHASKVANDWKVSELRYNLY